MCAVLRVNAIIPYRWGQTLNRAEELENMLHTMAGKNASAWCSVNTGIHYQPRNGHRGLKRSVYFHFRMQALLLEKEGFKWEFKHPVCMIGHTQNHTYYPIFRLHIYQCLFVCLFSLLCFAGNKVFFPTEWTLPFPFVFCSSKFQKHSAMLWPFPMWCISYMQK